MLSLCELASVRQSVAAARNLSSVQRLPKPRKFGSTAISDEEGESNKRQDANGTGRFCWCSTNQQYILYAVRAAKVSWCMPKLWGVRGSFCFGRFWYALTPTM